MAKYNAKTIMMDGIWHDNPVFKQLIGICSALAVTNLCVNSFIMGMGLTFVTALSCWTISLIRKYTPKHVRMMFQVLIIAVYVIIVDIFLRAYMPDLSKALGPYVGLIITNCIIMGRAEGYAQNNPPIPALLDGIANGIGYTLVLLAIAVVRELLAFGSLFGIRILPETMTPWTIMIMPPSAFFLLAVIIWVTYNIQNKGEVAK